MGPKVHMQTSACPRPEHSVHSPKAPWPLEAEALWPFQPGCWACPPRRFQKWRAGRRGGLGEISGQSERRAAAFITKTNSRAEPAAAHLVRGTSIICSSNLHELTVEGEREAASAGVHRVRAVCWPRSPGEPPKAAASQGRLCAHPRPAAPPPSPLGSRAHPGHRADPGRALHSPAPPGAQAAVVGEGPRRAALPSGHTDARPALARSLPGAAPRNPGIASPPGPGGAPRFPRAARRARPGRR